MKTSIVLVITALALAACGGTARPAEETTETWTSGDDEALGIAAEEQPSE